MPDISISNKKGKDYIIKSKEVEKLIEDREDIEYAMDISCTISEENIMAFDCKLSEDIFDLEDIEEVLEDIIDELDEEALQFFFEDVRAYIKDMTDEIEEELQEKYCFDNVRCYFDVYNIDETFTDFKFVFLVSFKEIKIASLTNLCEIVGKRQLIGASKFYS